MPWPHDIKSIDWWKKVDIPPVSPEPERKKNPDRLINLCLKPGIKSAKKLWQKYEVMNCCDLEHFELQAMAIWETVANFIALEEGEDGALAIKLMSAFAYFGSTEINSCEIFHPYLKTSAQPYGSWDCVDLLIEYGLVQVIKEDYLGYTKLAMHSSTLMNAIREKNQLDENGAEANVAVESIRFALNILGVNKRGYCPNPDHVNYINSVYNHALNFDQLVEEYNL